MRKQMRKPKNYQYYIAVGKLLKKALELIKHHNVQIDILCQLLCENDLEEDSIKVYELIDAIKHTPVYNFNYHKAKARVYERMLAKKAEECNHDKQHDDFDLRKYEYSGGTIKDFNDRCCKSFFDSIGLDKGMKKDDKDI